MYSKFFNKLKFSNIQSININVSKFVFSLIFIIGIVFLDSCSAGRTIENKSVDEIYNEAVELFNKNDLYDAKKFFDVIKLQYPASSYADDAQFYLAEIEFKSEKYIMSSFNFNLVKKLYPNSSYVKESQFKSALCYYKLSPGFERDLEYTNKAIMGFVEFQNLYPEDSLTAEAGKLIKELRNNLAAREHKIGTLYQKLSSPKAAIIYFDSIINDYDDTDFIEKAYLGKIESLIYMSKFENARTIVELYKAKFPNGELSNDVKALEAEIKSSTIQNKASK